MTQLLSVENKSPVEMMTNSRKPYIWSVEMSKVAWSENFKTTLKWETYIISWKWSEKITLTMNCISSVINWFPWSQIYIVMFSTRSTHEHSWNRLHIIMERRICTNRRSAYKKWFCINAPIPSTSLSLSRRIHFQDRFHCITITFCAIQTTAITGEREI